MGWISDNPYLTLAIVAVILTVIIMFMKCGSSKAEHAQNGQEFAFVRNGMSITAPSVLVNPDIATGIARRAEDIAVDKKGYSIFDYQLEDKLLYNQGVPSEL